MFKRICANYFVFGLVTLFAIPTLAMQKVLDDSVEFSEAKPNYTLVSKLLGILKGIQPKTEAELLGLIYDAPVKQHPCEQSSLKPTQGKDGRSRVTHTTTYPHCCFCHVHSVINDESYGGSGVLIGAQHVLTAAHCLFEKGIWTSNCSIYCGLDDEDAPYGSAKVVRFYVPREYYKDSNNAYDCALLVLDRPMGLKVGHLGCLFSTDYKMFIEDINVTGYPGDKGGKQMWTKANKVKAVSDGQLFYDGDATGGQSGGPVWSQFLLDDESQVVKKLWPLVIGITTHRRDVEALRKAGDARAEIFGNNTGVRLTEDKFMLLMNWMTQNGELVVRLNKSPRVAAKSPMFGSRRPSPAGPAAAVKASQPPALPTSPVDYDPRINEVDAEGRTALHRAVMTGNVELVKALILRWADVKIADKSGDTALHIAVRKGGKPIVQLLLDNRAEVNVRALNNYMPLHSAFGNGDVEIAELLIAKGAKVDVDVFCDGGQFGSSYYLTLLKLAEQNSGSVRKQLVRLLYTNGVRVAYSDAVRWGDKEMMAQLIERGNIQDALFDAIHSDAIHSIEMLELLLKKGAKPQEARRGGATLLHAAVRNDACSCERVRLLLEYGADVNAATDRWEGKKPQGGETPLHDAIYKGRMDVIEVLLKHGANPYVKNCSGVTPLDWAKKNKKEPIVKLIKELAPPSNFKKTNK